MGRLIGWRTNILQTWRKLQLLATGDWRRRSQQNSFSIASWAVRTFQMRFGLHNAPDTLQWTMEAKLLRTKLQFALVYLHEFITYCWKADEYISHKGTVLSLLHKAGVTMNLKNHLLHRKDWSSPLCHITMNIGADCPLHWRNSRLEANRQRHRFESAPQMRRRILAVCLEFCGHSCTTKWEPPKERTIDVWRPYKRKSQRLRDITRWAGTWTGIRLTTHERILDH